jgi:pyruvate-ferredoxin/flavodoxin oxidoreductase
MRPLYHQKAERLRGKAERLEKEGMLKLSTLKTRRSDEHALLRKTFAHVIMGLGGENEADRVVELVVLEPPARELLERVGP